MNSACRMDRARASKILAGAAQPSSPSTRNVIVTEAAGEVFSGSMALTISRRKSQGMDNIKSIAVLAARSIGPPAKPGTAPMAKASNIEITAAAGASRMETLAAMQQSGKTVAAQVVGPEPVAGGRSAIDMLAVLPGVVETRHETAGHTEEDQSAGQGGGCRAHALHTGCLRSSLSKSAPELASTTQRDDQHGNVVQQRQIPCQGRLPGQLSDAGDSAQGFNRDGGADGDADGNSGQRQHFTLDHGDHVPEKDSRL